MARVPWRMIVVAGSCSAVLVIAARPAQNADAPASVDRGRSLFRTSCATCHGPSAKGDGPLADVLRTRPPDLTLLAKSNGGKFAADKVASIIDGRESVKGHGGPDMPVWGDAFKASSEGHDEATVKARIKALVDYLESIQVKWARVGPTDAADWCRRWESNPHEG